MFIPPEWTVIAKRTNKSFNGVNLWTPCYQYNDKQISMLYDLAMKDVCFMVHRRTDTGFDLMLKINRSKAEKKEYTNYLSNKLYNN